MKKVTFSILVVILICLASITAYLFHLHEASQVSAQESATHLGQSYYQSGEYEKAILEFTKALEAGRKDSEVYISRGLAYQKLEQHQKAISDFTKAIRLNPKHTEAFFNRGVSHTALRKYPDAIHDYNKAINIGNINPKFFDARGLAYIQINENQEALDDFSSAIKLNSNVPDFYSHRGSLNLLLSRYQKAIPDFTKAIELDSKNAEFYLKRGICNFEIGKYQLATTDAKKMLEINSENPSGNLLDFLEPFLERRETNLNRNIYQDSIALMNLLIEINKNELLGPIEEIYVGRGEIYLKSGDREKALADYNKALELNPKFADAYAKRGALLFSTKSMQAFSDLTKAINLGHYDSETYFLHGKMNDKLSNLDGALFDYSKAIELGIDKEEREVFIKRGDIYFTLNRYSEALADYNKAIKLEGENILYASQREVRRRRKKAQSAIALQKTITESSKKIKSYPKDFNAYLKRADTYLELQKYPEAINDYREVIKLKPKYGFAFLKRGILHDFLRNYPAALEDFTQAIKLIPKSESPWSFPILTSIGIRAALVKKRINFGTNTAEAYLRRGIANYSINKKVDALSNLNSVINLYPDHGFAYCLRGLLHRELGNEKQAEKDIQKALFRGYHLSSQHTLQMFIDAIRGDRANRPLKIDNLIAINRLRLTISDLTRLYENPNDQKLTKKASYIYHNPQIVIGSFSTTERKKYNEFINRTLDKIDKNLVLNYSHSGIDWLEVIRSDYDKIYPFKVNFLKPELGDWLIMFFHETYVDQLGKKPDKIEGEDAYIGSTISKYASPSIKKDEFTFPFRIGNFHVLVKKKDTDQWLENIPKGLSRDEFEKEFHSFIEGEGITVARTNINTRELDTETYFKVFAPFLNDDDEYIKDKLDKVRKLETK